jgi:phosphoenolpyruvate---glycerone phosphotransferase subunit DhaL
VAAPPSVPSPAHPTPAHPTSARLDGSRAVIDAAVVRAYLARAQRAIARHAAELTRLDAVLGDGDHGDNLVIGFQAVAATLAGLPAETPPGELLRAVGHRLVAAVGGASGPLYGTAFIEAGFRAGEHETLDLATLADMLRAAADGLARRGRCTIGDKTILDTLRPAAEAFGAAVERGVGPEEAAAAAIRAGQAGMRSTRPLVARRGLAIRLGPRSAGHLDPGAVSCYLLVRALVVG